MIIAYILFLSGVNINIPSFGRESYIELNLAVNTSQTFLQITFNPASANGYIFFAGSAADTSSTDYLSLSLMDRSLELNFDLGTGPLHPPLRSAPLELNVWHTVMVTRENQTAIMFVDGVQYGPERANGSFTRLDVQRTVSLGGPRDFNHLLPVMINRDNSYFQGCIAMLAVSSDTWSFSLQRSKGLNPDS